MADRHDGALQDAYTHLAGGRTTTAIGNPHTGLGTSRDKFRAVEINLDPRTLSRLELQGLYRNSRICEKAVRLLPEAAVAQWVEWEIGEGKPDLAASIAEYDEQLGIREGFAEAGRDGRLYGDAFLILGIDDGQDYDQPVNESRIRSVRWVESVTRYSLQPAFDSPALANPEYYQFLLSSQQKLPDNQRPRKIHKSRVLRFPGKRLPKDILRENGGYNDSFLQAMFQSFSDWFSGLASASGMLADYSIFKYKLSGLSELIESEETSKLLNHFLTLQMGMSVLKGLMMDAETEDAEFIQRNYGGVSEVIDKLQETLIADSDMPRSKLLGSSNVSAFSEGGLSDRYEWADSVERYQESVFRRNLKILGRYILLSKDGPTKGHLPNIWSFKFKSVLQLTDAEKAELEASDARTDALRVSNFIIHPREARGRLSGAEYRRSLTLDPTSEAELQQFYQAGFSPDSPNSEEPTTEGTEPESERKDSYHVDAYVKRVISYQGFRIGLEYLPGDNRFGRKLRAAYGHIRKHIGADGEALDVYVSPALLTAIDEGTPWQGDRYFRVIQRAADGDFDEHKYHFGYRTAAEVEAAYQFHLPARFFGGVEEVPLSEILKHRRDNAPSLDRMRRDAIDGLLPVTAYYRAAGYRNADALAQEREEEFRRQIAPLQTEDY